ncbi:MAG: NERD domain-containing protein [Trichlorobacter sp.]|uniref:nuclease-related domain-containing protein n=1 Tax=Trichlorobacter sp. TaxID=2911007 RepID=UPI0025682211|nr:nuclease-related domain-containing protein [Trichlorobacter sp.]MDK9718522.1 NERD domain-containing protein [Trichlorobacter sp.]
MILKHKDNRQTDIQELNRLLTLKPTAKQRFLIERELKCLVSGERNEQNSAYYLDFSYKDSQNWAVIHDLRIEHRDRVAQIDHLLINRFLDVYVLESKNYYYGVKITEEGEFLVWDGKTYQAIESPFEQNQRHILALQQSIADRNLAPKRLGFAIPINFRNIILVAPTSKLLKSSSATFDLSSVIKADAFVSMVDKIMEKKSIIEAPKIIGTDTLREFGEKLVRLHRPGSINYAAKFGLTELAEVPVISAPPIIATPEAPVYAPAPARAENKPTCKSCRSENLAIIYGKFGYYFKCGACDGNTPLKISCGKDGHNERIRKDGQKFFRECADCGSSSLYFVNQ